MIQYSHKNHYLRHILLNAKLLFPGSIRATSVYYDDQSLDLVMDDVDISADNLSIKALPSSSFDIDQLDQLRKQKLRYSWLSSPFTREVREREQLQIHTEYDNHTLLIRFPNKSVGLNDLLFIFFKNEEQLFRFTSKSAKLSTELKQSIASVYVRNLDVIRQQILEDKKIYKILSEHINNSEEVERLNKNESDINKGKQQEFYKSLIQKISSEFISDSHYSIDWTDEAIDRLIEESTRIEDLENRIKKALIIAVNEEANSSLIIKIKARHISQIGNTPAKSIQKNTIDEKHKRTYSLLDRYEKSALQVLQAQLSLTGTNLGKHLDPPVSAAAISDAIRKHSSKITLLLNEYPNKWEIIRKQFRPIQNKAHFYYNKDQLAS